MPKIKYTTQTKLAAKLGVKLPAIQTWIQRKQIKFKIDDVTGVRLVHDIDSPPTNKYVLKENKK